jgi:hypothetical protein
MSKRFKGGTSYIPQEKQLSGQNEPKPHVLFDYGVFASKPHLTRPFTCKQARQDQREDKI